MIIKTCLESYAKLEAVIRENHPYEIPEVIALSIKRGSLEYLDWITENTRVDVS